MRGREKKERGGERGEEEKWGWGEGSEEERGGRNTGNIPYFRVEWLGRGEKTTKSSWSVTGPVSPPCFNVSDRLKTCLWEVVTPTKPSTAAILHRGCEQWPGCQCLTEIIAVPTGSFGRQMVEAIPIHLPAAIS